MSTLFALCKCAQQCMRFIACTHCVQCTRCEHMWTHVNILHDVFIASTIQFTRYIVSITLLTKNNRDELKSVEVTCLLLCSACCALLRFASLAGWLTVLGLLCFALLCWDLLALLCFLCFAYLDVLCLLACWHLCLLSSLCIRHASVCIRHAYVCPHMHPKAFVAYVTIFFAYFEQRQHKS